MTALLTSLPLADFGGHMDFDGDRGVPMILGMVLFWGLIIVGIVWAVREIGNSKATQAETESDPLRLLDRRLAEGAISPDDYRERRSILDNQESPPND